MFKKYIFTFILLLFFSLVFYNNNFPSSVISSFDTVSIKYFPLNIGDFWIYNSYIYCVHQGVVVTDTSYKTKAVVISSFLRNNYKYYVIENYPITQYNGVLLRTDSITGSLYKYDSTNSCPLYYNYTLIDSLSALINDSIKNCSPGYFKCSSVDTISIFSQLKIRKKFTYCQFYVGYVSENKYFTSDFGLTYDEYSFGAPMMTYGNSTIALVGCRINGVIYGDTSTTGVLNISRICPSGYRLYQNYPNPFNPFTKISFDVPKMGFVSLKVYDLLGREVRNLLSEVKPPGSYSVDFDASELSSGVYFYKYETGNYLDIKKMVLIK